MRFIKRSFKNIFQQKLQNLNNERQEKESQEKEMLKANLHLNMQKIKKTLGNSSDLLIREVVISQTEEKKAAGVFYIDGLAEKNLVQQMIHDLLKPGESSLQQKKSASINALQFLKDYVVSFGEVQEVQDYEHLFMAILSGETVILVDGFTSGLIVSTKGWESRNVSEPEVQTVIRGPREGFTENIRTNTSLIRRKIKSPDLWVESRQVGSVTKTDVAIMYVAGIVNRKIVAEVRKRLNRINIDGILESNYIEELIQDDTYTPFPTIFNTERPDAVAAGLLEGRVAILVDGTPFVLLVPALFIEFYQSSEDYYWRADIATLVRLLRLLCFFIALLGPSLYIAIITYHQEMVPTTLLISIAAQREGIPFPAFVEALLMEVTFEILREAGVRMPRAVGQAISIVGALVIGQAAVEAGLVSPAMVIVVAITAIANFVFPAVSMAASIRILRFGMMLLAASFGLFGVVVGLIAIVLHLCSLRSFGVPYMTPFGPFVLADQKDTFIRIPEWGLLSRPRLVSQRNVIRKRMTPPLKSRKGNGIR